MSRTRKQRYRGSRAFDSSCRSHGGCPWCLSNHLHADQKRIVDAKQKVVEAAVEWGGHDHSDEVKTLASEIGIAVALGELEAAENGTEPCFVIMPDGRCGTPEAAAIRAGAAGGEGK